MLATRGYSSLGYHNGEADSFVEFKHTDPLILGEVLGQGYVMVPATERGYSAIRNRGSGIYREGRGTIKLGYRIIHGRGYLLQGGAALFILGYHTWRKG